GAALVGEGLGGNQRVTAGINSRATLQEGMGPGGTTIISQFVKVRGIPNEIAIVVIAQITGITCIMTEQGATGGDRPPAQDTIAATGAVGDDRIDQRG